MIKERRENMGNLRNRLLKILLVLLALSAALFGGCILYLAITDPIKQPYRQYFYPILLPSASPPFPFSLGCFMAIVSCAKQTAPHRKPAQWYRHYGKSKFAPSPMASCFCWSSLSGLVWQKQMMPPALCSLGFCPFAGQFCLTSGHTDTKTDC